jgi:hypothetical protein
MQLMHFREKKLQTSHALQNLTILQNHLFYELVKVPAHSFQIWSPAPRIALSLTLFLDTVSTGNILFVDTKKDPASSFADTKKDPASLEEVRRRYCLDLVHMGSTLPTSDCKLLLLFMWNLTERVLVCFANSHQTS